MNTQQCCIALNQHQKSGLILCQPSKVEFMGPGALIVQSDSVPLPENSNVFHRAFLLGNVQLESLNNFAAQKRASWRRVEWRYWLRRVKEIRDPVERIELLLQSLNIFFGDSVSRSLPADVLARLVSCNESQMSKVREHYFQNWSWENDRAAESPGWKQLTLEEWQTLMKQAISGNAQPSMDADEGHIVTPKERWKLTPKVYDWRKTLRKTQVIPELGEEAVQHFTYPWTSVCQYVL